MIYVCMCIYIHIHIHISYVHISLYTFIPVNTEALVKPIRNVLNPARDGYGKLRVPGPRVEVGEIF